MKKLKRFLEAWRWLLAFQLERFKSNVIQVIFYGSAVRVNAVIGFVTTVKCIMWMADPASIPSFLSRIMPEASWFQQAILIFIPAIIFLMQALLQSMHDKSNSRLLHLVADDLTKMALVKAIKTTGAKHTKPGALEGEIRSLPKHYRNILTIEAKLFSVISMTLVLIAVLMAGFFIHWGIMVVMLFVGLACSLAFFYYQHRTSRTKETQLNEARERESLALANIKAFFHQSSPGSEARQTGSYQELELVGDLALSRITEKAINAKSALFMNLGQAGIVAIFLFAVLRMAIDELPLSYIAILAIIFRFILGYALVVVRDAGYLLANHHKLIAIKKKCI